MITQVSEFIITAGIPGVLLLAMVAIASWLAKTVPELLLERRKARSILLWIEIEARIARDQLKAFDDAFRTQKHQEIERYAAQGKPYRLLTAVSNQPGEYEEWRRYIQAYPVELVRATAIYIELDIMIDGLLQKMESENFEKLDDTRQKYAIDVFLGLCRQKEDAIDSLLSLIEADRK
jgi:hypothetical protein